MCDDFIKKLLNLFIIFLKITYTIIKRKVMKNHTEKRSTHVALFISLLIHFQLILLFFYNKTLKEDIKQKNLLLKKDLSRNDWGSTQERALSYAAPIFFKNEPETLSITNPLETVNAQHTTNIVNEEKSIEKQISKEPNNESSSLPVTSPQTAASSKKNTSQPGPLSSTNKKHISSSFLSHQKKSPTPTLSHKTKLTLSQLTQGFLNNNSKTQGSHAVTMIGKKNTAPTDEQLKYERYLERIHLCLQNCYAINREKCPYSHEKQLTAKIFLALNRDGTIYNLALANSCGNNRIDSFFLYVFRDASSSFPPVPTYLPQNPFSIMIQVNLTQNHFNTYQFQ